MWLPCSKTVAQHHQSPVSRPYSISNRVCHIPGYTSFRTISKQCFACLLLLIRACTHKSLVRQPFKGNLALGMPLHFCPPKGYNTNFKIVNDFGWANPSWYALSAFVISHRESKAMNFQTTKVLNVVVECVCGMVTTQRVGFYISPQLKLLHLSTYAAMLMPQSIPFSLCLLLG